MAAAMDVDTPSGTNSGSSKKRFEVKKWNAVALWAWDIVVDNCAICRNHIMDLLTGEDHVRVHIRRHLVGNVLHLVCHQNDQNIQQN